MIPDDVKVAAMDAYIAFVEQNGTDITKDPTEAELLSIVANAIMAERENCANELDALAKTYLPGGPGDVKQGLLIGAKALRRGA